MRLIHMIPINELQMTVEALSLQFPQFSIVCSQGFIKIYEQVR